MKTLDELKTIAVAKAIEKANTSKAINEIDNDPRWEIVKGEVYSICGDNVQYAKCVLISKDETERDIVAFQRLYYDKRKSYPLKVEAMYVKDFIQIIDKIQTLVIHE